jgi:4-amino-4-deoxy-L-arabinose transferase-like glycosyltransferase
MLVVKETSMKIVSILVFSCVLFIYGIGGISLWDPDEPRQAIMAQEMMERQDYIHPYLNGKPYLEKPPLYPWMIIAASKIQGKLNEFSSRIPAALSATCLMVATYSLGRLLVDPIGGMLSVMVLATNFQFLRNARSSVMDMTFAFFIGLTILLNYVALKKDKKWLFFLSFLPSSLAILAKGPAGLVIPAAVTFIYLITEKKSKKFMIPLALGCLASAAIAAVWFLLAGEAYWKEFILRQNFTRYTNAFDHKESFLYYFHKLFFNFLPWSILLPFSIHHAWKKHLWLPLIWFFAVFIFFEFSSSKRAIYLLSLYPAAALLTGIFLREKWSSLLEKGYANLLMRFFAVLLVVLPFISIGIVKFLPGSVRNILRDSPGYLYIYIILFAVTGAALLLAITKKTQNWSLYLLIGYLTFAGFFHNNYYMPLIDKASKSPRLIIDGVRGISKDTQIYAYGFSSAGLIFYLGRPIKSFYDIDKVKDFEGNVLLIIEDRPAARIREELEKSFVPLKHTQYEKENYTVYLRKD